MSDGGEPRTVARTRVSHWPGWIWAIPIAALGVAAWLGVKYFVHSGPTITVVFTDAGGVEPGDTDVRYRGVKVGKVEDLEFAKDHGSVVLTLQMDSGVEELLRKDTRFWIVGANVDIAHPSTLKALLAGPYIEMDPGGGSRTKDFRGLAERPVITGHPDGTEFALRASRKGSVDRGSLVYFRGLKVGNVTGYEMAGDGDGFDFKIFVRAPFDKLVARETRFWDAGAVSIKAGGDGLSVRLASVDALLQGAVAFDSPPGADGARVGHAKRFELYDSREAAMGAPIGEPVRYMVRFDGAVGDLDLGAAVRLRGFRIGEVVDTAIAYDAAADKLETPVTVALDPTRLQIRNGAADATPKARLDAALAEMIHDGLRARLEKDPPLVGGSVIVLSFDPGGEPRALDSSGPVAEIPAVKGGSGIASIAGSAKEVLASIKDMHLPQIAKKASEAVSHIDALVASPKVTRTIAHLEQSMAHIDRITDRMEGKVGPLVESLRQTSQEAQSAVRSADAVLGGRVGSQDRNLPSALHELTRAARAMRALADYLDRHPEAVISGR